MLKSFRFPVVIVGLMAVLMFAAAPSLEAAPPVNDACSAATVVTMSPAFSDNILDTLEATSEASPVASCNLDPTFKNQHSVWYVWTAPTADPVEINTFGSNYDTVVAVWSGACGTLTEVACNDDNGVVAHGLYQALVTFTPVAGTTYYFEVMGYDDLEFGSLVVNVQAPGASAMCEQPSDPQLISSSTNEQSESSINAAGEAVWVEYNPANNYDQIMSNKRGALVTDAAFHYSPSINGLGDVVWSQVVTGFEQVWKRSNAGAVTTLTTGNVHHSDPAINDSGEVVWVQLDSTSGYDQIFSSTRGLLTSSAAWHYSPAINNSGEVCWSQYDPATLETQIACLGGGMITTGVNEHYSPSINNAGTIVWSEVDAATGDASIVATPVSVPVPSACPIGKHLDPTINNCGDIVFTNKFASGSQQVYILGSGASCLPNVMVVSPASVPEGTATSVTLAGTGFTGATAVKLSNGTSLTAVVVISDASITATVPATVASGTYDVQVTTANGTNQTSTGKVVVELACNPDVDFVQYLNTSIAVNGVAATSANVCDQVVISANTNNPTTGQPTGCKPEFGYQVRRKGVDPYWKNVGGAGGEWKMDKSVTWDTRGLPSGNYTIRVFARNYEGQGNWVVNQKGGELTPVFTLNAGCADPAPNPPLTCNPDTNFVTQLSTSVKVDGVSASTAIVGQQVVIDASTGGTGCVPEFGYQLKRKGIDPYWMNVGGAGGEWKLEDRVVWDTTKYAPGTYTIRVFARNYEGQGNWVVNQKGGELAPAFNLQAAASCFVSLSANPWDQYVQWNESFQPVNLATTPSNCGNIVSYTFEFTIAGANTWIQVPGCEQPSQGANQLCAWNANASGAGSYDLRVTANDGFTNPVSTFPAYTLDKKAPVVSLSATPASPKTTPYGSIVLTGTAWYFNAANYYFEYKKSSDPSYTMICNWSTSRTCNWDASGLTSGTYDVKVYASDHAPTQEAVGSITYVLSP